MRNTLNRKQTESDTPTAKPDRGVSWLVIALMAAAAGLCVAGAPWSAMGAAIFAVLLHIAERIDVLIKLVTANPDTPVLQLADDVRVLPTVELDMRGARP